MGLIMNSEFYNVYVDDNAVAENMPFQYALVLTKAIFEEFYVEPNLKVTIERIARDRIEVEK